MAGKKITQLPAKTEPVSSGDKFLITDGGDGLSKQVDKDYLPTVVNPTWKSSVRVATTEPVALATGFAAGQTIDGIELVEGDRVLNKDATDGTENGILVVPASGAPARASDYAAGSSAAGTVIPVEEGTLNTPEGKPVSFVCTNDDGSDVVDTDALVFAVWGNDAHASTHIKDGSDELVGCDLACGYSPTAGSYTPTGGGKISDHFAGIAAKLVQFTVATNLAALTPASGVSMYADNTGAAPALRGHDATWTLGTLAIPVARAILAAGALATPSLSVREDTTGIYSPATNQVGFVANNKGVLFGGGASPSFAPIDDAAYDLGTVAAKWRQAHIQTLVGPLIAAPADPVNQAVSLVLSSLTAARTITVPDDDVDLQYSRVATTSAAGASPRATQAEVDAGTDADGHVTPETLAGLAQRAPVVLSSSGVGAYTISDAAIESATGFPVRGDLSIDQQDASADLMAYTIATAAIGSAFKVTIRNGQAASFTGSGVTLVPMDFPDGTPSDTVCDASIGIADRCVMGFFTTATRCELYGGDPA